MTIPFIKMHGLGNDYVYIDCFPAETAKIIAKTDLSSLARRVSDRHTGIGSDGLVLILPSQEADARMRIFNADGSEAKMCGNAIRCVGKYLYESGLCVRTRLFIETLSGVRTLTLDAVDGRVKEVTVNMGMPRIQPDALMRGTDPMGFTAVDMGNPHAVFFRDTVVSDAELSVEGQRISTHPHFAAGTNVEFVRVLNEDELDVRVWERGSGITMACGTGACAAAVAAIQNGWTNRVVTVHLPGGDLQIRWGHDTLPVYMTGTATEVFRGEIPLTSYE
ncbi:MAG: diaminopimelate epimerase [Paludibacteraceae bacterium]|nr:diaminopimelate epimerase [Paludibacteraceae bacterium]